MIMLDLPHHGNVQQLLDSLELPCASEPQALESTTTTTTTNYSDCGLMRPAILSTAELASGQQLQSPSRTSVGLHWDNIHVSSSSSSSSSDRQVSCACCDALETTVFEYREIVAALYRRWLITGEASRATWRQQGDSPAQIKAKSLALRDELFPLDGFVNETMAAACDEELMAYVCTYSDMSHTFRVCPDEPTSYAWMAVFDPAMRTMCRRVLQPFRVAADRASLQLTRSPVLNHNSQNRDDAEEDVEMEEEEEEEEEEEATRDGERQYFVGAVSSTSALAVGFVYAA